jgi:hypothetical protein
MKKDDFLKNMDDWSNHRLLLWLSLRSTIGNVLELGCGNGSTPYLQQYCKEDKRKLRSYDFNEEWADKFGVNYVNNWGDVDMSLNNAVALVDESPGENRKSSIKRLINTQIIVVHDSEPKGINGSNYEVRDILSAFKYKVDVRPVKQDGAWATAVSNELDIAVFVGEKHARYEVFKYM